jgi:hypothetical protein
VTAEDLGAVLPSVWLQRDERAIQGSLAVSAYRVAIAGHLLGRILS